MWVFYANLLFEKHLALVLCTNKARLIKYLLWNIFLSFSLSLCFFSVCTTVSIDDIDAVRHGRMTEGLQKYTDPSLEERCFSIVFKGRRKNLDLMANSIEEAKRWVTGLDKVISNMRGLDRQKTSEQYPFFLAKDRGC